AAPLVAQIALATPDEGDATNTVVRRDKPASFSQVRFPSHGKRPSKAPLVVTVVAVLLAAAAGAAWYAGVTPESLLGRAGQHPAATAVVAPALPPASASATVALPSPVAGQSPAGANPAPTDAKPAEEMRPVISNAVPLISVPPVSQASAIGAGAMPGITPSGVAPAVPAPAPGAPAAAPAVPAAEADALVLAVHEDSWVEVRPAKGRPLFSGLVKGGRTETIKVTEPVTLIVGKPSAVDATLRGAALALPAAPGGKTARVSIK
ncbi:MAG: DUF4115 domain-containing protein, partial [Massilia sp.]